MMRARAVANEELANQAMEKTAFFAAKSKKCSLYGHNDKTSGGKNRGFCH
jgi:hypothetical protein